MITLVLLHQFKMISKRQYDRSRVGTRQQIKCHHYHNVYNLHCLCVIYKDCSGWFISIVDWPPRKVIHKVYSVCSTAGCSLFIAECIVTFKVPIYIIDLRSILKRRVWCVGVGWINLHKCFFHHIECIYIMPIFATINKRAQHPPTLL